MANKKSIPIPSAIFKDRSMHVLEAIVKYLKEQKGLTYHEIAMKKKKSLNINTYSVSIRMANKKSIPIPSTIFKDRSMHVLEAIVKYLKEKKGLTYHEIAILLNRNDRTIWTVYQRIRKRNVK